MLKYLFNRIRVDGERNNISIPIGKTDMRFFPFQERGSEFGYELGFVSEVILSFQLGAHKGSENYVHSKIILFEISGF